MEAGNEKIDIKEFGSLLLNIGSALMSSGASATRTRMIIDRIADAFTMQADMLITHRALSITVASQQTSESYSQLKRSDPQGVNYKIVSGISRMSWSIKEHRWTLGEISCELQRLRSLPHYHRLVTLGAVGFADACFCYFLGGAFYAMPVAFVATFAGLYVRQQLHKMKFNPYLCVFFAAFAATMIAGIFKFLHPQGAFNEAFASCVLFLIPGVPMINAFTDLIDGNILNGILRGVNGLIISFMISMGMILTITIFNF